MGMFDFLSNYAMQPRNAIAPVPAVNDPGGLGVQPATPGVSARPGFTYGDILGALMQRGSKPGSSGAALGQSLGDVYGGAAVAKKNAAGQLMDFGATPQQQQQKKTMDAMSNAARIFSSVFGMGGMGG